MVVGSDVKVSPVPGFKSIEFIRLRDITEFLMNENWADFLSEDERQEALHENYIIEKLHYVGEKQKRINTILCNYEEIFIGIFGANEEEDATIPSLSWLEFGLHLAVRSTIPLSGQFTAFMEDLLFLEEKKKKEEEEGGDTISSSIITRLLHRYPISTLFLILLIPLCSILPGSSSYETFGRILQDLISTCQGDASAMLLFSSFLYPCSCGEVATTETSSIIRVIGDRANGAGLGGHDWWLVKYLCTSVTRI